MRQMKTQCGEMKKQETGKGFLLFVCLYRR